MTVAGSPPSPAPALLRLGFLGLVGAGASVLGIAIALRTATPAATVDKVAIPVSRVDARVKSGYVGAVTQQGTRAEYARAVLSGEISRVLVEQLGRDLKVRADDKTVQAEIAAEEKAGGGATSFYRKAETAGYTRDQVVSGVRDDLLTSALATQLVKQRPPTEADVQAFYRANPDQFVTVHVAHISTNNKAVSDKVASVARAHPVQFGNLARTYSLDKTTAAKGGDLGTITKAQYAQALGANAAAPVTGAIIGPLVVGEAKTFDLIHVLAVSTLSLDQARPTIVSLLSEPTSPYARQLVSVALSVTGKRVGVKVKSSYGTWDFDRQEVIAPH